MGLGLLGRGVQVIKFLIKAGAIVTVTDLKSEEDLASSLKKLAVLPSRGTLKDAPRVPLGGLRFVLGKHEISDFQNADLVIRAPNAPLDSIFLKASREAGVSITQDAALFAELMPAGVILIGVTGTRGKSTTTHLIFEILKKAGRRVFIGGNVRDGVTLPLLQKVRAGRRLAEAGYGPAEAGRRLAEAGYGPAKEGDFVVLELDSWQLQSFGDAKISPNVSVFTNLMPDHMNYYKGDMKRYFEDKAQIFKNQKAGETLVIGSELLESHEIKTKAKIVPFSTKDFPKTWKSELLGEHNIHNCAAAVAAARALNISDSIIKKAVADFNPVPGRLEFLRNFKGIKIYNDNNATTAEATLAALRAFPQNKKIILIMGGADKALDMSELADEIPNRCKDVVFLKETGTEKFKNLIDKNEWKGVQIEEAEKLSDCLALSLKIAKRGDIILFSPAFASFGKYFKNEYDRNDQFVSLVKKLK